MNTDKDATISAIRTSAKDPMQCSIRVGRKVVARISREKLDELKLAVGVGWTCDLARRVEVAQREDAMRRYALKLIARRAISSGELVDRLMKLDYDRATAMQFTQQLIARRMLDDEAYGRSILALEMKRKPAGRRLIEQKLFRRKIPREVIVRLLGELDADEDHDPVSAARALAMKKASGATLRKCDAATRKRRLWSLLARRGFSPGEISDALRDLPGLDDARR